MSKDKHIPIAKRWQMDEDQLPAMFTVRKSEKKPADIKKKDSKNTKPKKESEE